MGNGKYGKQKQLEEGNTWGSIAQGQGMGMRSCVFALLRWVLFLDLVGFVLFFSHWEREQMSTKF